MGKYKGFEYFKLYEITDKDGACITHAYSIAEAKDKIRKKIEEKKRFD